MKAPKRLFNAPSLVPGLIEGDASLINVCDSDHAAHVSSFV